MKIVGVTTCTVGIAHTYMAAEALEKMFAKMGHECKIERDGSVGPENELTAKEIEEADAIVFAIMGTVIDVERFDGYEDKTIKLSIQEALRKPEKVVEMLKENGLWKE